MSLKKCNTQLFSTHWLNCCLSESRTLRDGTWCRTVWWMGQEGMVLWMQEKSACSWNLLRCWRWGRKMNSFYVGALSCAYNRHSLTHPTVFRYYNILHGALLWNSLGPLRKWAQGIHWVQDHSSSWLFSDKSLYCKVEVQHLHRSM